MSKEYFHRIAEQTLTKFWINNPTRSEAKLAIEMGAVGCTQNPSYTQKMLDHPEEGIFALSELNKVVDQTDSDFEAARLFQRILVKNISDLFLPIYKDSDRNLGYVSIQNDPHLENVDDIIDDSLKNQIVNENISCKVPCDQNGLIVMEVLFEQGVSVNVTEVFAVDQAIATLDLYDKAFKEGNKKSVVFLSHIAGIYDDYLSNYVSEHNIVISSDVLHQGGLAVARKVYNIMKARNSKVVFVGGGARGLHHFTEMVGGDVCITINWSGTADELLKADFPVVSRLFNPVEERVIDELMEKLPAFRKGYLEGGLEVDEFEFFGPVQLFKGGFVESWNKVLSVSKQCRGM